MEETLVASAAAPLPSTSSSSSSAPSSAPVSSSAEPIAAPSAKRRRPNPKPKKDTPDLASTTTVSAPVVPAPSASTATTTVAASTVASVPPSSDAPKPAPPSHVTAADYDRLLAQVDRSLHPPRLPPVVHPSLVPLGLDDIQPESAELAPADAASVPQSELALLQRGVPVEPLLVPSPRTPGGVAYLFLPSMLAQLSAPQMQRVLGLETYTKVLSAEERNYLRTLLPPRLDGKALEATVGAVLGGANVLFGNPVAQLHAQLRDAHYHPLVARERAHARLLQRAQHSYGVKAYHNLMVRSARAAAVGKVPRQYPAVVMPNDVDTESDPSDEESK